jgi:hypothetical protein
LHIDRHAVAARKGHANKDLSPDRKRGLEAGELVLIMGANQMRTPNIAMIAAACGFDGVYIDPEHNPTSLALPGSGSHSWPHLPVKLAIGLRKPSQNP